MFPIVGPVWENNVERRLVIANKGVPTNGASGTANAVAATGSLLTDTTNGNLYINTGLTANNPTWSLIGGAAGGAGALNKQLSVAGAGNGADTTEDTLFTYSLPANSLGAVGNEVDIEAWGSVTATSATKTVKVYFGTTVTQTLTWTTTQTGAWGVLMQVFKQAASVQLAITKFDSLGATITRSVAVINNGSETDTAAIVLKVTGQSTVGTANTVLCNGFVVSAVA